MDYPGTVQGEAARLYAGFTYRKPVMARIDSILQLDPERLNPAHEYPRSVNPPSQPSTQSVDLADYVVRIGASGNDGMSPVHVWMRPNEYTAAREPLLVCEFHVAHALTLRHEYRTEAERRAFVKPNSVVTGRGTHDPERDTAVRAPVDLKLGPAGRRR